MRLSSVLALSLVAAGLTGCASFDNPKDNQLNTQLSKAGETAAHTQSTKVDVIFQPEKGKPQRVERALSEPTTVQQILEQTGGIKKYRRIEVEVVRSLPNGGFHKIPCEFDRSTMHINPEFDYALMPGDKVIVKEDKSTVIDDMMHSAGGGLGKRFSTGGRDKANKEYRVEGEGQSSRVK